MNLSFRTDKDTEYGNVAEYHHIKDATVIECEVDNNYSEILVADELCPQLSRISFPSQTAITGGRRLIQCEFFVNSDDEIKKLEKSSHNDIVRVLNYKNMK